MYNFETKKIIKKVKNESAKKVVFQVPNALKSRSKAIARLVEEKTNAKVIILGDSCYGACDLADQKAKELNADLLVHFGHSPFGVKEVVPTLYVELREDIDVLLPKGWKWLENYKKVGLAATVQHVHKLNDVKRFLEEKGKEVLIGVTRSKKVAYPGQVLGCDVSTCKNIEDEVDCFLCVSGGNFHGLGVACSVKKPVFILDPYKKEIRDTKKLKRNFLKKKYARIEKASEAERFGLVVGLKKGQLNLSQALKIKKKLEERGKEAYLIAMNEIDPQKITSFLEIDVFIITACPRLAYDLKGWKRPVINVEDFYETLEVKN